MSRPGFLPPGPGTPPALPQREPARCTCTRIAVPTLEETLGCPDLWQEMPDGIWVHIWPPRKRQVTR